MLTAADLRHRMTEAEWQHAVVLTARSLNWRVYHTRFSVGSDAGFPDLVLVRPPRLLFVELKRETGTTTAKQDEWLAELALTPAETYLWRPSDNDTMLEVLR